MAGVKKVKYWWMLESDLSKVAVNLMTFSYDRYPLGNYQQQAKLLSYTSSSSTRTVWLNAYWMQHCHFQVARLSNNSVTSRQVLKPSELSVLTYSTLVIKEIRFSVIEARIIIILVVCRQRQIPDLLDYQSCHWTTHFLWPLCA